MNAYEDDLLTPVKAAAVVGFGFGGLGGLVLGLCGVASLAAGTLGGAVVGALGLVAGVSLKEHWSRPTQDDADEEETSL